MLSAARKAGFRVRVTEARRSAERQAYLLTLDGRLTHTATSRHAEGFAVDVSVDDGNLANPLTRRHWIAFRRWVVANEAGVFRLIGTPGRSWDCAPHRVRGWSAGLPLDRGAPGDGSRVRRSGATDCTAAWRLRLAAAERTESTRLER